MYYGINGKSREKRWIGYTVAMPGAQNTTEAENYAFVMNVNRLVDATSFTLAPGHELRRASVSEVASIKDKVGALTGINPFVQHGLLWERQLPLDAGGAQLPESSWRYFVIGFKGSNGSLAELSHAFELAHLEFEVGVTFLSMEMGPGYMWNPGRLFHVLEDAAHRPLFFVDVAAADVEEIAAIHSQLQKHDNRLVDVEALVIQLGQLKAFPHSSPLRFLGYFAILESLLTHAPRPLDPYDSITRQVRKKLALLDHRFPQHISYDPFGGASPEAVWTKMYAYRSQLAHGGNPQFKGELQVLISHDAALTLIKETTKAVIRQALLEPQLLVDLREC